MSSPSDPIRRLSRLRRFIDTVGVMVIAVVLVWALWPAVESTEASTVTGSTPGTPLQTPPAKAEFPVGVFDRTLWHEPPAPVMVTPPKPPEMPRLELVGIRAGTDGLRAMIYDPTTEELHTIGAGDTMGVTRVLTVEPGVVVCEAHGQRFELRLDGPNP